MWLPNFEDAESIAQVTYLSNGTLWLLGYALGVLFFPSPPLRMRRQRQGTLHARIELLHRLQGLAHVLAERQHRLPKLVAAPL